MIKKISLILCTLALSLLVGAQELKSPNGQLVLQFSVSAKGEPTYSLSYKDKTVLKPSRMGIELKDEGVRAEFGF